MQEGKRLKLLRELLQFELQLMEPCLAYIEDLELSIKLEETNLKLSAYQMVEN